MSVLEDIVFWCPRLPFASIGALGGYFVLALLVVPRIRRWLSKNLVMPAPSTGIHLAPLDAFRGLAALLIVVYHYWDMPRPVFNDTANALPFIRLGDKAVPIFCVLSGFLIYRSLRKVTSIDEIRLYAKRRLLRVYPLYVASVVLCVLCGPLSLHQALGELFMLQVFGFDSLSNPVIWSLYVEVVFYAILPVVVFSIDGRQMLMFSLCSFGICGLSDVVGPMPFRLWKFFLAGIIASEFADRGVRKHVEWFALGAFVCGVFLLVLDFRRIDWFGMMLVKLLPLETSKGIATSSYTMGLALASVLIVGGSVRSAALARFFGWTPFRILGTISYSMFVWHGFMIAADFPLSFDTHGRVFETVRGALDLWPRAPAWLMMAVPLPAVLFWATVSFLFIERPFLSRRPRRAVPGLETECEQRTIP
jgi:peptidoglycan/LPS O-acetylase OafA/YrhL